MLSDFCTEQLGRGTMAMPDGLGYFIAIPTWHPWMSVTGSQVILSIWLKTIPENSYAHLPGQEMHDRRSTSYLVLASQELYADYKAFSSKIFAWYSVDDDPHVGLYPLIPSGHQSLVFVRANKSDADKQWMWIVEHCLSPVYRVEPGWAFASEDEATIFRVKF